MLTMATQPTLFGDYPVLADVVRIFIIFTGVTLALVCAKIGARALHFRDWERGLGAIAFALIVVTPSITGLYRFNEPLALYSSLAYVAGLVCGIIAMAFRVTIRWRWWQDFLDRRLRGHRQRRRARNEAQRTR